MNRRLLVALLAAACRPAPPPPVVDPRPVVALAFPATGPEAIEGARSLRALDMALAGLFSVISVDSKDAGVVGALAGRPGLVGVVVWAPGQDLTAFQRLWDQSDLIVVIANPGSPDGIPHVVPNAAAHARCVPPLLPAENLILVHDGTPDAVEATAILGQTLGRRVASTVAIDNRSLSVEAARIDRVPGKTAVFSGAPETAANLLRALRRLGSDLTFVALDAYTPSFLEIANEQGEGVRVTTSHRPVWDAAFLKAYTQRYNEAPSPAVVDTYDAALLVRDLREAMLTTAGGHEGVRLNLKSTEVHGAGWRFTLDDTLGPEPSFCDSFEVHGRGFAWSEVARLTQGTAREVRTPDETPRRPKPKGEFLTPPKHKDDVPFPK